MFSGAHPSTQILEFFFFFKGWKQPYRPSGSVHLPSLEKQGGLPGLPSYSKSETWTGDFSTLLGILVVPFDIFLTFVYIFLLFLRFLDLKVRQVVLISLQCFAK